MLEVEVLPEFAAIDTAVFDFIESEALGVDVVNGEEGFYATSFGDGGDEAGHPIVAVDEVWLDSGDDVGGEFALEGESHAGVVAGFVDLVAVVEGVVFGEVDPAIRDFFEGSGARIGTGDFGATEAAKIGESEVNFGAEFVKFVGE